MKMSVFRMIAVAVLSVSLVNVGVVGTARAGVIDTLALVSPSRDADLAVVRSSLERKEVRDRLQKMGVPPSVVDVRVANLSDPELHRLAQDINHAPAGGDGVLAVVGAVFIVLIILDYIGVINIFKRHR